MIIKQWFLPNFFSGVILLVLIKNMLLSDILGGTLLFIIMAVFTFMIYRKSKRISTHQKGKQKIYS